MDHRIGVILNRVDNLTKFDELGGTKMKTIGVRPLSKLIPSLVKTRLPLPCAPDYNVSRTGSIDHIIKTSSQEFEKTQTVVFFPFSLFAFRRRRAIDDPSTVFL